MDHTQVKTLTCPFPRAKVRGCVAGYSGSAGHINRLFGAAIAKTSGQLVGLKRSLLAYLASLPSMPLPLVGKCRVDSPCL